MRGLILFSHGSVLCGAAGVLARHAARLRGDGRFTSVEVGFLNYTEPTFEEAMERVAATGARQVVVTPYFLVPGRFATVDIPGRVASARRRWTGIEVTVAEPLGYSPALASAVVELAAAARGPGAWRAAMERAVQLCERRPTCPLYGTERCAPSAPAAETPRPVGGTGPTALLLLVHGSPRPDANEPVMRVVHDLEDSGEHCDVSVGFLERNEPDIPTALDRCAATGVRRVVAVPYFLHAGAHVARDLPSLLEQAGERHPGVEFLLSDLLGSSDRVTEVLLERALAAAR